MTDSLEQEKIIAGKEWAEAEMRTLAIERTVKLNSVHWVESTDSKVWIATINSAAGEHTIAIPYSSLIQCAGSENGRMLLRERIRHLIGDLARIERRGFLR